MDVMKKGRRVILLEFNELSPSLMFAFMSQGKLPNFKRLHDESEVLTSEAAERAPDFDPWIQWVTVHTGLEYKQHGIFRLDEGHTLTAPRLWDLVSEAGQKVWVCGSMNVGYRKPLNGCLLPDPWTTKVKLQPAELQPFFDFVQRNVLEHTARKVPLSKADYGRFLTFMLRRGLSLHTITAVIRQLAAERSGKDRWKRVVLLDKFQYDVFAWYYRRLQPRFSSFFLNSTAHYQHLYWREMDPDPFSAKPTEAQRATYRDAIEFGYREMDGLVGRVFDLAGPDTTIVLATALSQQPCLLFEEHGGKFIYRPEEYSRLTTLAGVTGKYTVAPVMSQQFHLYFESEREALAAADRLAQVRYGDRRALAAEPNGLSVFVGCRIYERVPEDAVLTMADGSGSARFLDVFYQVDGVKSGMHHQDGLLWLRRPERTHSVSTSKVPLAATFGMLLNEMGISYTREHQDSQGRVGIAV